MKIHCIIIAIAALVLFGCASERRVTDSRHPEVKVTPLGSLEFRGEAIDADDLPDALRGAGYTSEDTINILVPADIRDYRLPYYIMGILSRNGYRRPVLVKERRAYSISGAEAHAAAAAGDRTVDGHLKKQATGPAKVVYPPKRQQRYRAR